MQSRSRDKFCPKFRWVFTSVTARSLDFMREGWTGLTPTYGCEEECAEVLGVKWHGLACTRVRTVSVGIGVPDFFYSKSSFLSFFCSKKGQTMGQASSAIGVCEWIYAGVNDRADRVGVGVSFRRVLFFETGCSFALYQQIRIQE